MEERLEKHSKAILFKESKRDKSILSAILDLRNKVEDLEVKNKQLDSEIAKLKKEIKKSSKPD